MPIPVVPTDTQTARSLPRKRTYFAGVAGALLMIAIALLIRWQAIPAEDPLRGDAEDTSVALAKTLAPLSDSARISELRRFAADPSPGLRFNAIDTLSERKDPALADVLEQAYTDSSSIVRQKIIETLPDSSPARGLRLLMSGLRDEDMWIREAAIQQLKSRLRSRKSIVDRRIVPALIATLDDPDSTVPFMATSVLASLTGNHWQYKSSASLTEKQAIKQHWKQWWQTAQQKWPTTPELAQATAIQPTRRDPSPDFHLTDLDGKMLSREGQHQRLTLLNFWGTWCPPCQGEVPDLVRIDQDLRGKGVDVIGVALSEDSGDSLRHWCTVHHVTYRQTLAQDRVLKDFGDIHEVPVSILIDGQGQVRRRWEGERDYRTFRAAIENIQAEDKHS